MSRASLAEKVPVAPSKLTPMPDLDRESREWLRTAQSETTRFSGCMHSCLVPPASRSPVDE